MTAKDPTWNEVARLKQLAEELKRDPVELALEQLATYREALRATRLERDELRRQLLKYTWSG
jgi:hypothetical protein